MQLVMWPELIASVMTAKCFTRGGTSLCTFSSHAKCWFHPSKTEITSESVLRGPTDQSATRAPLKMIFTATHICGSTKRKPKNMPPFFLVCPHCPNPPTSITPLPTITCRLLMNVTGRTPGWLSWSRSSSPSVSASPSWWWDLPWNTPVSFLSYHSHVVVAETIRIKRTLLVLLQLLVGIVLQRISIFKVTVCNIFSSI